MKNVDSPVNKKLRIVLEGIYGRIEITKLCNKNGGSPHLILSMAQPNLATKHQIFEANITRE